MGQHSAIIGVGITPATSPTKQSKSVGELSGIAARAALAHANLTPNDIDAVVVGSMHVFHGTAFAAKHEVGEFSGLGVPVFHVNTGGSTGGNTVNVGNNLVESGAFNRVLCLGPASFDAPVDMTAVINTASPVIIEQPLGFAAVHMGAFFLTAYMDRYGATEEDFARISVRCYENARDNPFMHIRKPLSIEDALASRYITTPLRLVNVCPASSGASAVLLASEKYAEAGPNPPVWVKGAGSSGDTYLGGGRHDFAVFENLAILGERIFRHAGVKDPRSEIDLLELFAPMAPFELLQLEALGFCGPGEAVRMIREDATRWDGPLPVNPDGGIICSNPGVAAQLGPYAYAALQLMGQAPGRQVKAPKRAIAHSSGGNFFQFHTLAVLEVD